ncbi:MAG: hypothetical protein ACLFSA_01015 [Spirochaetaceae bacterium]
MNRLEEKLKERWLHLGEELRRRGDFIDPPQQGHWETIFIMLSRLYSGGHRYYHNLEHVDHCLRLFDSLCLDPGGANKKCSVHSPLSLELAIWFHDAVYTVGSSKNEEESALLAEKSLKEAGLSRGIAREVEELVLCTDYGGNPASRLSDMPPDCSLVRDIDISILGDPWSSYLDYTGKIRREYGGYPESEYRERRKELLYSFLKKENIFETEYFYRSREKQARENMRREISELLEEKL